MTDCLTPVQIDLIIKSAVLLLALAIAVSAYKAVMKNIDKYGDDREGKATAARRAEVYLWIFVALIVLIFVRLFDLLGQEAFVSLFAAGLSGLGIKIGTDLSRKL